MTDSITLDVLGPNGPGNRNTFEIHSPGCGCAAARRDFSEKDRYETDAIDLVPAIAQAIVTWMGDVGYESMCDDIHAERLPIRESIISVSSMMVGEFTIGRCLNRPVLPSATVADLVAEWLTAAAEGAGYLDSDSDSRRPTDAEVIEVTKKMELAIQVAEDCRRREDELRADLAQAEAARVEAEAFADEARSAVRAIAKRLSA